MPNDTLHQAQAAEVDTARRATSLRQRARWWLKTLSLVVGLFTSAAKAWLLMRARDVGRADMPKGTDMATLATDRVEKPKDAGR